MTAKIVPLTVRVPGTEPDFVTDTDEIRAKRDATIVLIDELLGELVSSGDRRHTATEWKTRCTMFHHLQQLRVVFVRLDFTDGAAIDRIDQLGDDLAAAVREVARLRTRETSVAEVG